MNLDKSTLETRKQSILDAAAELIIRLGYDKTTMSDIASRAGVTRAIVYLHFDNKEALFDALLVQETLKYLNTLLHTFENDTRGGLPGFFRCVLYAVQQSPFMSAMMIRDRRYFGSYLMKPNNIFRMLQSDTMWQDTLQELQAANAIRQDLQPFVVAHIMHALSIGLINIETEQNQPDTPPFTDILEAIADMMDRLLEPDEDMDAEAGYTIIHRLVSASRNHFETLNRISGSNLAGQQA